MKTKKQKESKELGHPIQIAKMVDKYEWTYYCTFTTRNTLSMKRARELMELLNELLRKYYPQLD